jgi:hypothetical protein
VASRQFGHQPMRPRLGARAWRAGRHMRDEENTEALWAHRSASRPPGTEPTGPAIPHACGTRGIAHRTRIDRHARCESIFLRTAESKDVTRDAKGSSSKLGLVGVFESSWGLRSDLPCMTSRDWCRAIDLPSSRVKSIRGHLHIAGASGVQQPYQARDSDLQFFPN